MQLVHRSVSTEVMEDWKDPIIYHANPARWCLLGGRRGPPSVLRQRYRRTSGGKVFKIKVCTSQACNVNNLTKGTEGGVQMVCFCVWFLHHTFDRRVTIHPYTQFKRDSVIGYTGHPAAVGPKKNSKISNFLMTLQFFFSQKLSASVQCSACTDRRARRACRMRTSQSSIGNRFPDPSWRGIQRELSLPPSADRYI